MADDLYPLLFTPVYRDYIWGGHRILRRYRRTDAPALDRYAESWEIADRPRGMSVVRNGPLAGQTLRRLMRSRPGDIVGRSSKARRFPLLIKIIDARERLSVQVHPDNRSAARHGGEAKTEMWVVLDARRGARIFAGLKPGTRSSALIAAIRQKDNARVESLIRHVAAVKGEVIYVPGGRVHAVGEGCLLLEIQQNSDTTYRVCDWGRVGPDGKPRPLHVREALRAIRWNDFASARVPPRAPVRNTTPVLRTPYFRVDRIDLGREQRFRHDGRSFQALFVVRGRIRVAAGTAAETIGPGTSCLIPAALRRYILTPIGPGAEVIRTSLV